MLREYHEISDRLINLNEFTSEKKVQSQPFQQTCDDSASTTCDEFVKMRTNNNTTLFSRDRRLIERCSLKWRRGRSQSMDAFMHRVASFRFLSWSCSMQKKLLCNLKAQENGGNVCVVDLNVSDDEHADNVLWDLFVRLFSILLFIIRIGWLCCCWGVWWLTKRAGD